MNVDDKSEMTTSASSSNERTQRMNSKVNDQFEKADDTVLDLINVRKNVTYY